MAIDKKTKSQRVPHTSASLQDLEDMDFSDAYTDDLPLIKQVGTIHTPAVDWSLLPKLFEMHTPIEDAAGLMDLTVTQLGNAVKEKFNCSLNEYYHAHSAKGRTALRRKQYELAMNGNPRMLKQLGTAWLGQTDKVETNSTVTITESSWKIGEEIVKF